MMKIDLWVSCEKGGTGRVTVDLQGLILKTPPIWHKFTGQKVVNLYSWLEYTFGKVTVAALTEEQKDEKSN